MVRHLLSTKILIADQSLRRSRATMTFDASPTFGNAVSGATIKAQRLRRRPLVLHITGDYPDPVRTSTTMAVKRLIDGTTACDHVIISLVRSADPRATYLKECPAPEGQRLFAVGHFGLPFGIGLEATFQAVARRIDDILVTHGLRPDLIHSHRLTFDGIAGSLLAQRRQIPHVVSVRGEVESKVLRFKPTYRTRIAKVLAAAQRVYFVSAWYRPEIERLLPDVASKARNFPNIVANCTASIQPQSPVLKIVTAANLDIYKKKGIDRLIEAFARAGPDLPGVTLEIFGGGSDKSRAAVAELIATAGLTDRVELRGAVSNAEFLAALPSALALALPSRNETFGMVYTEALFAGVPILYSRGSGIDGYLDGLEVGVGVPPNDVTKIAEGLVELSRQNQHYRKNIAQAGPDLFQRFDPVGHLELYTNDVVACVDASKKLAQLVH